MSEGKSLSTGMTLEETGPFILFATVIVSLVGIIVLCVCGCRKSIPKNELLGLAGKVKITNPDQNITEGIQNGGHNIFENGLNGNIDQVDSIILKEVNRNVVESSNHLNNSTNAAVSTATRSLPDLPVDTIRTSTNGDGWEKLGEQNSGGDTGSELYATVEEHKTMVNGRLNKKASQSTNAVLERSESYASPNTNGSLSPYACFKKEHPYDKVKQVEHPYAQVTSATKKKKLVRDLQSSLESSGSSSSSSSRTDESKEPSPLLPGNSRRRSWQNSDESSSSRSHVVDNIPAAGAISGAVAASNDLPYMTPPILQNEANVPHFSGDSQDSGKGYTSISVREPLSNIVRRPRIVDSSHYATVSDDSDEMYAAIEEPANIYTSGSETYAKIAPIARPETISPPQLPSVSSLRSVAHPASPPQTSNGQQQHSNTPSTSGFELKPLHIHTGSHQSSSSNLHSRQSSGSSAISSDHTSERRQANSPLPKTPENINDMYAKVIKQKKSQKQSDTTWSSSSHEEHPGDRAGNKTPSPDLRQDLYESLNSSRYEVVNEYERIKKHNSEPDEDPNYERIHKQHSRSKNNSESNYDLGYERIHKLSSSSNNDPESNYDMGYERIHKNSSSHHQDSDFDIGYERIQNQDGLIETDPNYERIQKYNAISNPSSNYDVDVGYEQIHKTNSARNFDVGYEQIHKNNIEDDSDPNYEELKTTGDAIDDFDDPNYEVLTLVKPKTTISTNNQSNHNNNNVEEHKYACINKSAKRKYRNSEPDYATLHKKYESTYECMSDCFEERPLSDQSNSDVTNVAKPANSVARIEVKPNVLYSQVQKYRDKR